MNTAEIKDVLDILAGDGFVEARKQLLLVFERERERLRERLGSIERALEAMNGHGADGNGGKALPVSLPPNALGLEVLERAEARLRKPDLIKVCQEPGCPRQGEPFEAMRKNARFCPKCRVLRQSGWAARQKDGKKPGKRGRRREARV